MSDDLRKEAHDLDVTVWVGKGGIDSVVDELDDQLDDRDLVKVRFHDAAMAHGGVEELAADLTDRVDGELIETRGKTAVIHR